jgi:hypothetical protein
MTHVIGSFGYRKPKGVGRKPIPTTPNTNERKVRPQMIILGLVLLVVGMLANISILTTIGMILMVAGAILWVLGATGRAVGGRSHYW